MDSGVGPNPRLDKDDTNGFGPENINIDEPLPGRYRIFSHYHPLFSSSDAPTEMTVRIYLNGLLSAEFKRVLNQRGQVWAVADIIWKEGNQAHVMPYPSDRQNEAGTVQQMPSPMQCQGAGWIFP